MLIDSHKSQTLFSHGVLGIDQRPVSLWSSWEFVLILAILICFLELVTTERYFWSSKLGLMTSLCYLNFLSAAKFSSHHNLCLNLKVIFFLTLSMFCKMSFSSILQWFNQAMVSLHQHRLRRSWFWFEFHSLLSLIKLITLSITLNLVMSPTRRYIWIGQADYFN